MTTQVYFFLPPPNASGQHREAYPYGPDGTTFHTDLGIEIDPAVQANNPALAVVPGLVIVVPNPSMPGTASLLLIPARPRSMIWAPWSGRASSFSSIATWILPASARSSLLGSRHLATRHSSKASLSTPGGPVPQ